MKRRGEKEMRRKGEEEIAGWQTISRRLVSFSPLLLFLIVFFVLPLKISAATLAEYREKIQDAQILVEDLLYIDEENLSPNELLIHEREILTELRQSLPAEKVEWKGTSIETNNRWLQDKLGEYEKDKNLSKRQAILTEISERLATIEQKIDELENPSASNRAKDEDKRKLGEILRREEYQKPEKKEKSFFERLLDKIAAWFAKEAPTPDVSPSTTKGFQSFSFVLQILLYAVILGLIGFLIYRFAPFLATRFRRREKREKKDRVILGERISADETADNLFSEAERLALDGNLRGAIRKGYIALLCELSDRKIIGLSRHKTNRDYLRDVRKKHELYENMNGLTSNFERHWYGFEEAEEKDWEEFRNGYKRAIGNGGR